MVTSLELITTIKVIILIVLIIFFIVLFRKDVMNYLKKRFKRDEKNGKEIN